MKVLKIFLLFTAFSISAANAQFIKAELQVSGLTCSICSKATEKSLKTLPFISDIKPDLERNVFVLTFNNSEPVNFDQISKKVQDAGFFVNSLKATFNFKDAETDNHFSYGGNTYEVINKPGKPLSGQVPVTLVDQGFAPKSVSKKYLNQVNDMSAAKSGRVYHVLI